MSTTFPERIAELALSIFESLPSKCKPRSIANGRAEWTTMSAVILQRPLSENEDQLKCVSLATGTKCLHASALPRCNGSVLHDCHAEVLALRGLNFWMLNEIEVMLQTESTSDFVERSEMWSGDQGSISRQPFQLRKGISLYLFSTEAPCGDASMEILMSSKSPDEAKPWAADALAADLASGIPLGRGHFSLLGAMRRKPSRADAEPSMSKSCTDKLTLKQFTSLIAFPTDLFVQMNSEAYLEGVVVYPDNFNDVAFRRAFGRDGRLAAVDAEDAHFFHVHVLPEKFQRFTYEKAQNTEQTSGKKASNISTIWIDGTGDTTATVEVLINGVKQGFQQFENRTRKRSVVCRQSLIKKAIEICQLLDTECAEQTLFKDSDLKYFDIKSQNSRCSKIRRKQEIVAQLGGWPSMSSEDSFEVSLEHL